MHGQTLPIDPARRFGGIARLYGPDALARLSRARVAVVGVGGVGSWAAEALARSGIGHLTLIDLDHVAESNINRQIHALDSTLGASKVLAMRSRIADINPACVVEAVDEFAEAENLEKLFVADRIDYVIDAIDSVRAKTALIAHCHRNGIALVTVGGAGGRSDATRTRVGDLAHTQHEALLAKVRKRLRVEYGFSRNVKRAFGIAAVYSDEPAVPGGDDAVDDDFDEGARQAQAGGLNCSGYGSTVAVTAVFGFVAAGHIIERLARTSSSA